VALSGEWKWNVTLRSSYDKRMKNFCKSYETLRMVLKINREKSLEDKPKKTKQNVNKNNVRNITFEGLRALT